MEQAWKGLNPLTVELLVLSGETSKESHFLLQSQWLHPAYTSDIQICIFCVLSLQAQLVACQPLLTCHRLHHLGGLPLTSDAVEYYFPVSTLKLAAIQPLNDCVVFAK